jgi:hypothetical protein
MSNPQTGCDRLKHADETLRAKGWTQHTMHDHETGSHCLLGAMVTDLERVSFMVPTEFLPGMQDALEFLGFKYPRDLTRWNDDRTRKVEEVFERIAQARAQHCEDKNGA